MLCGWRRCDGVAVGGKKEMLTWICLLLQLNSETMTEVTRKIMASKTIWQQFYLLCNKMAGLWRYM